MHANYFLLVAGRTMIPSIVKSLERIANEYDPLLLSLQEISYKPLISLLNITEVTHAHPELAGLRMSLLLLEALAGDNHN